MSFVKSSSPLSISQCSPRQHSYLRSDQEEKLLKEQIKRTKEKDKVRELGRWCVVCQVPKVLLGNKSDLSTRSVEL